MSATFGWDQYNGTDAGTKTDLGTSGNLFNFKNVDSSGTTGYDSNPISAGSSSYEVWLKAGFSDTFNTVDNIRFWMDTDFSPSTGLAVYWKGNGQETGVTPATTNLVAVDAVPTADPETANVSIGGSLSGQITSSPGASDYIVLQLKTEATAAAGDTSTAQFTLQYDES